MFRLTISLHKQEDASPIAIIRDKRRRHRKVAKVTRFLGATTPEYAVELAFAIKKRIRELQRDLLYERYGDTWREMEYRNRASLVRSASSAMKRAKFA